MFISFVLFLSVTFIFTVNNGFLYDHTMIQWVDKMSTPVILSMMDVISMIGSSEVILLLTAVIAAILLYKKAWFNSIFFLTVSVGGVVLNFVLKVLFQRERPGEMSYIEVFNVSLEIPSYSFPSGHTMRSTILLLFIIYISYRLLRNTGLKVFIYIASIVMMLGVALSRLFLDAHFLSDTIAAISISVVWFCLCVLIFKRYEPKRTAIYRKW